MELGVQLLFKEPYMQTLEGIQEVFRKVADIGYSCVQLSYTCPFDPEWMKDQLTGYGLKCVLAHVKPQDLAVDYRQMMRDYAAFGCRHIGVGSLPNCFANGMADYDEFCRVFGPVARELAAQGSLLMLHNHDCEFERTGKGKELVIERIMEEFPPEVLGITLDTYWVQAGGADPAQWLRRLKGRVPCIHLKDMAVAGRKPLFAPVGEGNMNFEAILEAAEEAGTQYLLVEQDEFYGEDPFDCFAVSYRNLKALGA